MRDKADITSQFHPVYESAKLGKAPVKVELCGQPYVLFRDHEGRVAALRDVCPHRLTPLSKGSVRADGRLACVYHGWHFDREGRGQNPSQPSLTKCDVGAMTAVEHHGYVWIAARDTPIDRLPAVEPEGEGFESLGSYLIPFEVPMHTLLTNISDVEHLPYLHLGGIGMLKTAFNQSIEFTCRVRDDQTETSFHGTPDSAAGKLAERLGIPGLFVEVVTRSDPMRISYTVVGAPDDFGKKDTFSVRILSFLVPAHDMLTNLCGYVLVRWGSPARRVLAPVLAPILLTFARKATYEDVRFLPCAAHLPFGTQGMRLDKYDKPVVNNLNLFRRSVYFRELHPDLAPASEAVSASNLAS